MKKLNIWEDEGKVSVLLIEKFAENLGITFPKSYIDLISEHDYLSPKEDSFIFIDNDKNTV
jgi:SMI1 / KNR4 family protein